MNKDIYFKLMYEMIHLANYHGRYSAYRRKYGTEEDYYENEVHILAEIVNDNSVTLQELARKFYKTKSYISQVVTQLERRGLIEKTRSEEDGRKLIYQVTPKGLKLDKMHREYDYGQSRRLVSFFEQFETKELERCLEFLHKYHEFQLTDPHRGMDDV